MAVISDWDRTTSSDWEFLAGRLSYDATNDWIENNKLNYYLHHPQPKC